LEDGK